MPRHIYLLTKRCIYACVCACILAEGTQVLPIRYQKVEEFFDKFGVAKFITVLDLTSLVTYKF